MRSDGRLLHGWARGGAKQRAFLDDHAFLASALLDLYEASGDRKHLDRAAELVAELESRFHDPEGGGYFYAAHDGEQLIARSKPGSDGSLPSGNSVAALVLLRLHVLSGDDRYRMRAEEILRLFHDAAAENPFGFATYLQALEFQLEGAAEVVVVGVRGARDTEALWGTVAEVYLPHHVLVAAEPDAADPPAPARDRPACNGRATAYVCRNFSCSAPVTEPNALRALLEAK